MSGKLTITWSARDHDTSLLHVGQALSPARTGFQPALAGCKGSLSARRSRLKGGCGQNCPPHDLCRILKWEN
jgi:hypothetical protein